VIEFTPIDVKTCHVNIKAATPFTEIYVINAKFQRIQRELGESSFSLESGTYTFRFQEGNVIRDLNVYLDTDRDVVDPLFEKRKLAVDKTRGKQLTHKRTFSVLEHLNGVIFGIDVPEVEDEPVGVIDLKVLLTNVIQLDDDEKEKFGDYNSFVFARDIKLLRLVFTFNDEEYWLPIITHAMWKTFAEVQSDRGIESLAISLIDSDNEEAPFSNSFAQDKHYLKLSRIAMQALLNKRSIVSQNALKFLTERKWFLPWHGLLALHLQIQKPEPNFSLINIMLNNLEHIYDGTHHPDLLAIHWWRWVQYEDTPVPPAVLYPPTLSSSWKLLLMAHSKHMHNVFSPSFSNMYEPGMRIKGPWLFHRNIDSLEQRQNALKGVVKQTICEHMLGSEVFRVHVRYKEKEGGMTLSNSVINALKTMMSEQSYPTALLVRMVFTPSKEPEEREKFPLNELFNTFESTEMREKLALATAHSIFYLLELFQPEPHSEPANFDEGQYFRSAASGRKRSM
jgi:hypothetical protein